MIINENANNATNARYGTVVNSRNMLSIGTSMNKICNPIDPITATAKNQFVLSGVLNADLRSLRQLNACMFCKNTINAIIRLRATTVS